MEIRWLSNEEIERLVNPTLRMQGWAELNIDDCRPTCKVLGAFIAGECIESFTLQLYPILGPLIRHDNTVRDSGETSRGLAIVMKRFLDDLPARGYLAIANSPVTERLCKRYGMEKIEVPVYSAREK